MILEQATTISRLEDELRRLREQLQGTAARVREWRGAHVALSSLCGRGGCGGCVPLSATVPREGVNFFGPDVTFFRDFFFFLFSHFLFSHFLSWKKKELLFSDWRGEGSQQQICCPRSSSCDESG